MNRRGFLQRLAAALATPYVAKFIPPVIAAPIVESAPIAEFVTPSLASLRSNDALWVKSLSLSREQNFIEATTRFSGDKEYLVGLPSPPVLEITAFANGVGGDGQLFINNVLVPHAEITGYCEGFNEPMMLHINCPLYDGIEKSFVFPIKDNVFEWRTQ